MTLPNAPSMVFAAEDAVYVLLAGAHLQKVMEVEACGGTVLKLSTQLQDAGGVLMGVMTVRGVKCVATEEWSGGGGGGAEVLFNIPIDKLGGSLFTAKSGLVLSPHGEYMAVYNEGCVYVVAILVATRVGMPAVVVHKVCGVGGAEVAKVCLSFTKDEYDRQKLHIVAGKVAIEYDIAKDEERRVPWGVSRPDDWTGPLALSLDGSTSVWTDGNGIMVANHNTWKVLFHNTRLDEKHFEEYDLSADNNHVLHTGKQARLWSLKYNDIPLVRIERGVSTASFVGARPLRNNKRERGVRSDDETMEQEQAKFMRLD
jgi:hypothetical protein